LPAHSLGPNLELATPDRGMATATRARGGPAVDAGARDQVVAVARRLDDASWSRHWTSPDPYDGLNATRVPPPVRRSAMGMRLLTQAVKRSPLDLRPVLGIRPGLSAATLGLAISAYARNGFLEPTRARSRLEALLGQLDALRCTSFVEPCWGYHFDVQTRVFFYPRTSPNTIATAFAALGLMDAHELAGLNGALDLAVGTGEFFLRHVGRRDDACFGYLPGDSTPIHNANMLVCALLARLARATGRRDLREAATTGAHYTARRQRPDGSWPYGEQPGLEWVDGFHTGYVLDSLLTCVECGVGDDELESAWHRGLRFYAEELIEDDGLPRYTPSSRYPIDGQCAAQAIETLSRAADRAPHLAERRWAVFDYARRRLMRRDGRFVLQRRKRWDNRTPSARWVQAPMLRALAALARTPARSSHST